MYNVKVFVSYKESILDPKGEAIKTALHRLDYETVTQVKVGKYFELVIQDDGQNIEQEVQKMCDELLANVNMESYHYEISKTTVAEG